MPEDRGLADFEMPCELEGGNIVVAAFREQLDRGIKNLAASFCRRKSRRSRRSPLSGCTRHASEDSLTYATAPLSRNGPRADSLPTGLAPALPIIDANGTSDRREDGLVVPS